jgi:hypothetical protein
MTFKLLENYLQPRYKLDLSKPIALPYHVIRVKLDKGEATFVRSQEKPSLPKAYDGLPVEVPL